MNEKDYQQAPPNQKRKDLFRDTSMTTPQKNGCCGEHEANLAKCPHEHTGEICFAGCICNCIPCHSLNTKTGDWEGLEALSEQIHHLYCKQYLKDHGEPYWTQGDYSLLNQETKEYDRNIARFIRETHTQLLNELIAEVEGVIGQGAWREVNGKEEKVTLVVKEDLKSLLENKLNGI